MSQGSPKHIALSGQIASGKSTLLSEFKKAGWHILSADQLVHEVYKEHGYQLEELREKARSSNAYLRKLEKFVHPKVREKIFKELRKKPHKKVAVEIPLLFENGLFERFEMNIFVYSPKTHRQQRVAKRGMNKALFEKLEAKQWSAQEKAAYADLVIHNQGDKKSFRKSAQDLIRFLKK